MAVTVVFCSSVLMRRFNASGSGLLRFLPDRMIIVASGFHASGPDISRADFTWCMTALDWDWSIEEVVERLMTLSSKARENGENYALLTAQNAAAAVQRRRGQVAK